MPNRKLGEFESEGNVEEKDEESKNRKQGTDFILLLKTTFVEAKDSMRTTKGNRSLEMLQHSKK